MPAQRLPRSQAAAMVDGTGWRLLLGSLVGSVPALSLGDAMRLAAIAVAACDDADAHLRVDARPDRVELVLQTAALRGVTAGDVDLAVRIEAALGASGATLHHQSTGDGGRPVQDLELAIDAMDIPGVKPFWRAVLGYVDEPASGPDPAAIVDPVGQGPAVWFQQMDTPRPQRNRIHFDITVAHDEAQLRIASALAAGGTLLSDTDARAFWVLADPEGNEICVCTWQDRHP